jgi:hypothetical protein
MWESLPDRKMDSERLKVPGGWIVRSFWSGFGGAGGIHQVFIADPNHEWRL